MKKLLIFAFVLLCGWGLYKFLRPKPGESFSYQDVTVTRGDLAKSVQASGSVAPQNRVGMRPPFAGRLESVLVNEGDWVKKGQILAWLSSSERAALLDAAQARGPQEVKKWEDLYKPTPMLAPITGTLIARNFEPGQSVNASDGVLVISDRLIVRANVDETDMAQLKVGQSARITLDAYSDQPVEARAVHIAYEAKNVSNVTIYEVEVAANQTPAFMRSGMTASVDFFTERHPNVLMIPSDAIQPRASGASAQAPGGGKSGNAMADASSNSSVGAGSPRPALGNDDASGDGQRRRWNGQRGAGHKRGDRTGAGHGRRATVLVPGPLAKNGKPGDPIEKEIRTGVSDDRNTEVLEGLAEGDVVLLKTVALPNAAKATNNPFVPQRQEKRGPRGAR